MALAFTVGAASPSPRYPLLSPVRHHPVSEDYEADIRLVFAEAFRTDVLAYALTRPSFSPESVVAIRKKGDGFELFAFQPREMIWTYSTIRRMSRTGHVVNGGGEDVTGNLVAELKAKVPPDPRDLPLDRCAIALPADTAQRVLAAFQHMLTGTGPEDPDARGLDGTSYIFATPGAAGQAWEPQAASPAGRLVALTGAMHGYCKSGGDADLRRIVTLAAELA